ncbi:MAG TPA: hypothetical protein VIL88_17885 [Devosia sp.]|jgi:hypothetical protein|uniref:hypothetical protein n=1 Tax=Devosia sp. TaxID=1871048 RepID=UPI002F928B27
MPSTLVFSPTSGRRGRRRLRSQHGDLRRLGAHFSKKEGPPAPKVQEFYAAGQLADMGPVKELIESVGLVMQQMVRTNIALEDTAKAQTHLAHVFEARLEEERRDRETAEEVARQLKEKR